MSNTPVIIIENLHKKFCSNLKRSLAYGAWDTCCTLLGGDNSRRGLRKAEFWALENVSLTINKGETFGLIGANGSGKTTLLRVVNGIFPPDAGRVMVRGRVGGLIALGAGFHPHMTGRENIFLNGAILGMDRREIVRKLDRIIEFADIGNFVDAPVATYSSGMHVRLGFAIAIHCEPDIVLLDEVLAVGDAKFQRKCLDRIRLMREQGVTFILVSHNMQNIEGMCHNALLLHKGKPLKVGPPAELAPMYELLLTTGEVPTASMESKLPAAGAEGDSLQLVKKYHNFGTEEVAIHSIRLRRASGAVAKDFLSEESMAMEIELECKTDLDGVKLWQSFVYMMDNQEDNLVPLGTRKEIDLKKGRSRLTLFYPQIQLATGRYKTTFHLFDLTFTNPYTQGHYGYFTVKKGIPTQFRVGMGAPMAWADPQLKIETDEQEVMDVPSFAEAD